MNLLRRIIRLPLVTKNPVLGVVAWMMVTGASFGIGNNNNNNNNQIRRFDILSMSNHFVSQFVRNKAEDVNMTKWFAQNTFSLIRIVANSLVKTQADNAIVPNDPPNIMAGSIEARHLVNNMQGQIFVVGLSQNMINYLGLILLFVRGTALCIGIYYMYKKVVNFIEEKLKLATEENNIIDVESRPVRYERENFIKRIKRKN